jgi:hypothetical protein
MNPYSTDVYEGFEVTEEEVAQFKNSHCGFYNIEMTRVSYFLQIQIASISKHRIYNSFSITDVIQELEGVGRGCIQRVDQFRHLPLKGLWKAHFLDARFIIRNIINHWGFEGENSSKFNSLCAQVVAEEQKNPSEVGWQGRLTHAMIIGAYEEKAKRHKLTGEWLIFSKHNDQNYYLCISKHTSNTEDVNLFDLLKTVCKNEYPFLLSE